MTAIRSRRAAGRPVIVPAGPAPSPSPTQRRAAGVCMELRQFLRSTTRKKNGTSTRSGELSDGIIYVTSSFNYTEPIPRAKCRTGRVAAGVGSLAPLFSSNPKAQQQNLIGRAVRGATRLAGPGSFLAFHLASTTSLCLRSCFLTSLLACILSIPRAKKRLSLPPPTLVNISTTATPWSACDGRLPPWPLLPGSSRRASRQT